MIFSYINYNLVLYRFVLCVGCSKRIQSTIVITYLGTKVYIYTSNTKQIRSVTNYSNTSYTSSTHKPSLFRRRGRKEDSTKVHTGADRLQYSIRRHYLWPNQLIQKIHVIEIFILSLSLLKLYENIQHETCI